METMKRRAKVRPASMTLLNGNEPTVSEKNFRIEFVDALNFYNENWDESAYRKAAEHYVLKTLGMKDAAYALSKASFLEIRQVGAVGHLIDCDQYVDIDYVTKLFVHIDNLKAKYVQVEQRSAAGAVVSVQDRINSLVQKYAADIDGSIDDFITTGKTFSMKRLMLVEKMSGAVAKKIAEIFQPKLKEMSEALNGQCEQLSEAYEVYTNQQLKKIVEFIKQIVVDCGQRVGIAKVQRKPRLTKAKPASTVIKKMVYKRYFDELNLKSIPADKIIGATELWAYNTATRKLIVFRAADGNTLTVKGMSIANYDEQTSAVKTIRDPAKFFKSIVSFGKRAMANAWNSINAKQSTPRSRINEDVILLSAN